MCDIPDFSRVMSTQHPDNVHLPFFAESTELCGDDEVQEAYYSYSHLGCREQMWDCEGKEVDNFVVKKLLSRYDQFFRDHQLGKDVFLTLRVPNPEVERAEAKILLETLESIPRSFDIAHLFYGNDIPPIFQVILPMASSFAAIDNIYQYYRDFVIGRQNNRLGGREITIADWIGRFAPERIDVIPLFEDYESMLNAAGIVGRYLQDKDLAYQRVFLARSDPAMNYGMIPAILLNKIALSRLHDLSQDSGVPVLPIIGVGSAPFRGNLRPDTVERCTAEYPSVHTFTVQSAFKYDYPLDQVRNAVRNLESRTPSKPLRIDAEEAVRIVDAMGAAYQKALAELSDPINRVAGCVPGRRKRKLHIGLFGYSRSVGGITLPRAITFTAALYSVGLPPELLGLDSLDQSDIDYLRDVYVNFDADLSDAARFFDPDSEYVPPSLARAVLDCVDVCPDPEHQAIAADIREAIRMNRTSEIRSGTIRAANLRNFLG
ncbi:phosphoenolpyruvate carboxylase [Methanofollis fontis]|uniref:Phosphoenolpyruvate carboxylase n=1 Tax=Methanofollis fontis TaxID=2052832 RepID=A0A483CKU8_9EURY|nr:phosphoenolpyruvate carboxylase [Methanofollis fontis]TAJ43367.1 phosphoenolpyruvate carboxylase [Methanofollis fontis]